MNIYIYVIHFVVMSFYPVWSGPTLYRWSIHKGCSPEPPESSDGWRIALLGQHSNCDSLAPSPILGTLVAVAALVSSLWVASIRPRHWMSSHCLTAVWLNRQNRSLVPSWTQDHWRYCYDCFQITLGCKIYKTPELLLHTVVNSYLQNRVTCLVQNL